SDLFSVGILLLELDNISTFDISKTKLEQKFETKNGNIFQNFNLDRQSQIYKIATQCLKYEVNERKSAVELLIQFIVQNQQYLNVDIFTLLNKSQLKQKAEQLNHIQISIVEKKKKQEKDMFELSQIFDYSYLLIQPLEILMSKYEQEQNKPFEEKECYIILNDLLKMSKFDPNIEFISVGANGLVLGVFNKSENRHSALKIQRAMKHEVIREVGIMKECQMPLFIKFYDYFYLNVNTNEDFVVYEIEKCSGNLKQYLDNLKKQNKELDENQKMKIAIQIMDAINYLHIHDIVHRDIKLANLLYIEEDPKIPTIKLADFDQARKMPYDWMSINGNAVKQYYPVEGACGTLGYLSPEVSKTFLYSFKSDVFSVGVCLALLDNFETLESQLLQKSLDYSNDFSIPFEGQPFSSYYKILTLNYESSNIGSTGAKDIASEIAKRTNLSNLTLWFGFNDIDSDGAKEVASKIVKCTNLSTLTLYLYGNDISSYGAKAVAFEITKCTNLSNLTLSFQSCNICSDGAKATASEIAKCANLYTLTLSFFNNNINSDGAKEITSEIAKCTNLSTLSLSLQSNNIDQDGAKSIASKIAKCTNLSTLTLNLQANNIGSDGAKEVASEIAKCTNLFALNLDLDKTNIDLYGVKEFAYEISKCKTLQSLEIDLSNNNLNGQTYIENLFRKDISLKLKI
ncbi:hypothetical protein ABPG73_004631, partial [Tetrahymena malaccensis]